MMNTQSFKALKIQTIQTKTILKVTPAQLQSLIQPPKKQSDQTTPIHSAVWKDNIVPRSQERVCGLFNQETVQIKDTGTLNMNNLTTNNSNQNNLSKFAKRKSEAKLHINLNSQTMPQNQTQNDNDFNLDLDDLQLTITPETQKECLAFFKTMPSPTLDSTLFMEDILKESGIAESELLELTCIPTSELYDNTKVINPFLNESSFDETSLQNEPKENLNLDHAYSNKRKLSFDIEENSLLSQDSFNLQTSTPTPSTSAEPTKKKQRTRGIYRAKDVKNDEDLMNYLERRKKNNISSKVSRSNKKSLHNSMDAKADELEIQNKQLTEKIEKLQDTTKIMKEFLLQHFKSN